MAFIPTPRAIRLSAEFVIAGQLVVVTLSIQKPTGTVSSSEAITQAGAFADWWTTHMMPYLSTALSLRTVNAVAQDSISGPSRTFVVTPPVNGGIAQPAVPNNTAIVISGRTAERGRSARGRMYIPGCGVNDQSTATTFSGTLLGHLASAVTNLAPVFADNGPYVPGVISRQSAGLPLSTGVFRPYTEYVINTDYDSQRRRLAGRGV